MRAAPITETAIGHTSHNTRASPTTTPGRRSNGTDPRRCTGRDASELTRAHYSPSARASLPIDLRQQKGLALGSLLAGPQRWTLLILRDAFYGVRRFGDFAAQLGIPRAVLTNRLKSLAQEGVLTRKDDGSGRVEYRLTDKGLALWPAVHALMNWGEAFYSPHGAKRVLRHDLDGGLLDPILTAPTTAPAPGRQDGTGTGGRTKPQPSGDRTVAQDATTGCRGGGSNWA